MAEYKTLIATINANIRKNGNQEITGNILNAVLNAMVGEMGGNYQFAGVAKRDTDPGTPDQRVFYVAGESGVFPNFGGLEVPTNKVYFFTWDTAWRAVDTGILDAFVEAEAERARAEVLRATAEAQRVINENQRIANENLRQEAESGRNARYEAAEEERDAKYTTAETERNAAFNQAEAVRNAGETARVSAENERNANELERKADETLRKSAESARATAENARVSAESGRVTAESGRVSAENARATAESGRASAEATRVSNENSRISAENARKSAETARSTAEAQRVSTFNTNEANRASTFTANEAAREADYQANVVDDYQDNVKGEVMHLSSNMDRANKTLGPYDDIDNIVLTPTATNTCINKAGQRVAKTGWAIAEFQAVKGNEYLFKVGTMDGDVCIFSEKITKQEVRNIDYSYTYNADGTIATASATYNGQTHTYSYAYEKDEEGRIVSETITDNQTREVVNALPYQYKTSVGSYQPMTILNASAQLPKDSKCRLVSHFQNDTNLTVVVSYNMANADLNMEVIRDGFTASICTQLSNLAKRIANTTEYVFVTEVAVDTLRADVDGLLSDVQTRTDFYELPLMGGQPMKLFGAGTPQEAVVPDNWIGLDKGGFAWNGQPSMLGQEYINTAVTSGGHYTAVRDGEYNLKWINS